MFSDSMRLVIVYIMSLQGFKKERIVVEFTKLEKLNMINARKYFNKR
jgi:hypothetical protein